MSYNTDSPLLTRSTYLSDYGLCAAVPVYKRPVFWQSSPKLDLILNINVLESSPSASPFPHLLHKPLRVVSSNTRDFYSFKVLATSSLLVQVVLSRPVEALTLTVKSTSTYIQVRCNRSQESQNNRITYSKVHHELAMSWQSKYSSIMSWQSIDRASWAGSP